MCQESKSAPSSRALAFAEVTTRHRNGQALSKDAVDRLHDEMQCRLSTFVSNIDHADGRPRHKHERHRETLASPVNHADAMQQELDAMLQKLIAEKTPRRSSKASVGLEGVGEWARTSGNRKVCTDGPVSRIIHADTT